MSIRRFAAKLAQFGLALSFLAVVEIVPVLAQTPAYPAPEPVQTFPLPAPALNAPELDSLVAPVALYPDPLLSQIFVACTYPLEIVQAAQWLQQNPGLTGPALENAARQQSWDPSVEALLVFPDVLRLLSGNVQWATNLGNAFLSQPTEVMDAVQRMRAQAQNAGTLHSTPEMVVSTQAVAGAPPVIAIEPANPQVLYVPVYDPAFIWGAPLYPYPVLWYPRPYVRGRFLAFGPGVFITTWFGGWGGWAGWGWGPNWIGRTVIVNNTFFYRYGFRSGGVAVARGPAVWVHDSGHRWGVPYPYRQGVVHYAAAPRPAIVNRPVAVAPAPNVARMVPSSPGRASFAQSRPYAAPQASYAAPSRSYTPAAPPMRSYVPPRTMSSPSVARNNSVPQPRPSENRQAFSSGRPAPAFRGESRGESRGSGHSANRHR